MAGAEGGKIARAAQGMLTVLAAGELVEGVASDNGGVHGRHFEGYDGISRLIE